MKVLRPSDYRQMPWKNGLGETTEVAVWPPTAGLDDFDWRVSMAPVKSNGAFSKFPGIDRTLCILSGAGMRLTVDGQPPADVTSSSAPIAFPGDVPVSATLIDKEIVDLNVMTRRGVYDHDVRRLHYRGAETVRPVGSPFIVLCQTGAVSIAAPGGNAVLKAMDTMIDPAPTGQWSITAKVPSVIFLIAITPSAD